MQNKKRVTGDFWCFQLNMAKDSETVLEGFQEGPLKFPPTYKFDVGTDTYDTRLVKLSTSGNWHKSAPLDEAWRRKIFSTFFSLSYLFVFLIQWEKA